MKILVLIDAWLPFIGGAQVQVINLKKILEKKYGIYYLILHSPSSNIVIRLLWSFWVIPQAIFLYYKDHFDLIHSHAYWPGIPGKIISNILKIPIVFTVHGSNLLDLKIKSLKAFIEKIILTRIKYDQIISVSSSFLKHTNVNKGIKVVPNGVDIGAFNKVKIRKEKPFKVLSVGRNDPVKGFKYLRQAIKLVKRVIPQIRLKIINSGVSGQDLIKEYKSSHLFVLPSISEGQPLTLLEAWAAKLPVVVTAVGDNPKMVKNGYNGYLVKQKDLKNLAQTIIKLLRSQHRTRIGENGYQLVKRSYSWEKCALKTYEIYKKMV